MKWKTRKLILSILITLILLCSFLLALPKTFSLYETRTNGNATITYAFYVLKTNYFTQEIKLGDILPRVDPYTYKFTVSNFDNRGRSEVDLEYDLSIRTTTNLELDYELYIDEEYDDPGATDAIVTDNITADSDGTYFRHLTTATKYMPYTTNTTYTYQLVVYFPTRLTDSSYQDIEESVEITIDSRQIRVGS